MLLCSECIHYVNILLYFGISLHKYSFVIHGILIWWCGYSMNLNSSKVYIVNYLYELELSLCILLFLAVSYIAHFLFEKFLKYRINNI